MLTERDLFVEDVPTLANIPAHTLQLEPDLPLREVERRYILRTLQRAQGNRTEAAKLLGISVRCLQYKLKAYAQAGDAPIPPPDRAAGDGEALAPPLIRSQIIAV